ncbi:MAG: peptidylprolyl isomerase [Candidatus Saganbacteria bacterium]|nr:peptidylprolyl isomerase [Candidatus Saganbacteria bacterium]
MLTWLRKKMKTIMVVVVVLFAGSMFYGLGYRGLKGDSDGGKSTELAKVNGRGVDPLRYQEMVNQLAQGYGPTISPADMAKIDSLALGQTIDFTLMRQAANGKVKVSGGEIDGAVDNVMQQQKLASKKELEMALKRMGLSLGRFRDYIKDDLMVQKLQTKLQEEVTLTPDDLREVRASHILVSSEATAKDLLQQLKGGAGFAALAKKYSLDTASASKGGDLGYFSAGTMVESFDKAVFSLKPGELSGIVQSPYGYHVFLVADSRLRKFPAGQEMEKAALADKQQKTFRRWYFAVRSKAKIEVLNPALKGHGLRFQGHLSEAAEEYKRAIRETPANPYLHLYLGDTYLALGQRALALAEYDNAIGVAGGNPELYLVLGNVYDKIGEKQLAAEQFRKASLIAGDNKELHERLLKIFQQMKRPAEASRERSELARLAKREQFEKELTGGK